MHFNGDHMLNTKPKLKTAVELKPFDNGTTESKYIMAYMGRHWIIAEELYYVLCVMDGQRSYEDIIRELELAYSIQITMEQLNVIVEDYLMSKGMLVGSALPDETMRKQTKQSKYFWFQIPIISERLLGKMKILAWPYKKAIALVIIMLCIPNAFMMLCTLSQPESFTALTRLSMQEWGILLGIIILSGYIHEFGHIGACINYGMSPGHIGFAFYMTMPVLYADVSRVWMLDSKKRAVVDLGGMYFEVVFLSAITCIGLLKNMELLVLAASIRFVGLAYNFNPFMKMDGYWLFGDLTGIANLHDTVSKFLKASILKVFRKEDNKVLVEFKPAIRRLFYVYVLTTIVFFAFFTYVMATVLHASAGNIPVLITDARLFVTSATFTQFSTRLFDLLQNHFLILLSTILILRMVMKFGNSIVRILLNLKEKESAAYE